MEHLLSLASAELAIRSEVESTLSALLQDVEHALTLEQSLHAHNELHQCREQLASLKVRYEDREAAWQADRKEKERLGKMLLKEIVKLSAREMEGEKSKKEMELKLRQLEEEKLRVGESFARQQQNKQDVADDVDKAQGLIKHDAGQSQTEVGQEDGREGSESGSNNAADPEGNQTTPNTTNATERKRIEGGNESPDFIAASKESSNQVFVPHDLDETTLMEVFAYLDPLDVMNFAQTNKALLSKVNIMFGMSNGEDSDGGQQQTTSGTGGDATGGDAAVMTVEKTEPPPSQPPTISSVPSTSSAPATDATDSVPSTPAKSPPKLAGAPGPTHKRQGSGTSVATTGSAGSVNPFSQVSSWFSGAETSSTASVSTVTNAASANTATATASPDTGSEIKLNAAMATSMASKLTPAELSIILRMREKLQRCETDANKWRLEKEDAVANLASVEAVKEFLVTRVRDTERVVQSQKEEMKKVQEKNLEDQEVIVFLDERVKELEKTSNEMKSKEAATKKESMDIVNKNEKKARVLSDMLRFEREQVAANEKEWKAAKKVLVKEVRSCRARIVALEAELEGCRQQNVQLKQGLMTLTQSSGSMSPGGGKNFRSNGRF